MQKSLFLQSRQYEPGADSSVPFFHISRYRTNQVEHWKDENCRSQTCQHDEESEEKIGSLERYQLSGLLWSLSSIATDKARSEVKQV